MDSKKPQSMRCYLIFLFILLLVSLGAYFYQFKVGYISIAYLLTLFAVVQAITLSSFMVFGDFYLFSDEAFYWFADGLDLAKQERLIWLILNEVIKVDPIYSEYYISKFLNVPMLVLLPVVLSRVFKSKNVAIFTLIFLPYIFYIGTLNLRDIFAFILSYLIIYFSFKEMTLIRKLITISILMMLLLHVRWFYIAICIVSISFVYLSLKVNKNITILSLPVLLISLFLWVNWFVTNSAWLGYLLENGFYNRDESFSSLVTGNFLYDSVMGMFRYILAPIPSSIFIRLFEHDNAFNMFEDLLRFLNQTCYFFAIFYLIWNARSLFSVIKSKGHSYCAFTLFSLAHIPFYGVYFLGVTHQRVKLPFQMFVVSLALFVFIERKKNYENTFYNK
ncbi:hypothetical protein QI724_004498 [Vibrio parahaemolyticus]|nr:hypothetical protein [Vibrio parahaemolyticus]